MSNAFPMANVGGVLTSRWGDLTIRSSWQQPAWFDAAVGSTGFGGYAISPGGASVTNQGF